MSIVSSLQKIRTYNQDIRDLQGIKEPDIKTPVKKRPSIVLKRSKDVVSTNKNHHEIFINPRVEPITNTPKLLTAAESRTSPIETTDSKVEKEQTDEPRIKFNETKPEERKVAESATKEVENKKPTISIPRENQGAIDKAKAKIKSRKKDAQTNISKQVHSVSNHPESIQTSGRRDIFEVGEADTESATIVRDKKIKKNSVLSDIVSGLRTWFLRIKNTYITPPKPTYTINESERKAGVVQDATSQTGTALTDYDSFAKRLREKYKDKDIDPDTGETFTYETEPSWLPALPEYKYNQQNTDIKDIEVIAEKRADGWINKETPDKETGAVATPEETTIDTTQQTSILNNQIEEEQTDTLNQSTVEAEKPQTYIDPSTKETYNLPEVVPTNITSHLANPPINTTESDPSRETPTVEKTPETAPDISVDSPKPTAPEQTEEPITPETEDTTDELIEKEKIEETKPQRASAAKRARDLVYETAQNILSNATSEKEEVSVDSGVIPSSYHSLSEAKQGELRINKLSLAVVGGVLILILLVTLALVFFQTEDTIEDGVATNNSYLGNYPTQTLKLEQYDTSAERIRNLKSQLQNTSATLVQISPVKGENNDLLSTRETTELLNVNTPSLLFNVSEEMHFISDPNGDLIILLTINDRSQALGVMLQWEDSLTDDLSSLLSYVDTSGAFTDKTIAEIDIRSQVRGDDSHVISYAVTDDFILITNSRSGLETILKALD